MARHMARPGERRHDPFEAKGDGGPSGGTPGGLPDETMQFVIAADESRRHLAARRAAQAAPTGAAAGLASAAGVPDSAGVPSPDAATPASAAGEPPANPAPSEGAPAAASDESVSRNAALMSLLVVVSRITGFFRTWGQSSVLGVSMVASCYSVANLLPNQLYELVVGGMLVTAFLPVYLSVKRRLGVAGASRYASNLVSLVVILMGAVAVLGVIFASQMIWTQSFAANEDFDAALAAYLFRFFACEVVLYSLSSIFSGVLNAERDYGRSAAAPIFNNLVVTASFFVYSVLLKTHPTMAIFALAFGHPLGVAMQVAIQVPALRKHGIRIRPYVDIHDPAIRETLSIGIPSLLVMVVSFVTVSVQQSSALSVTAAGASVSYYSRLWYTLPYAILAVPITTTMFTELSICTAAGDMDGYRRGITEGTCRILFFLVPFALYLIVFSEPLMGVLGHFNVDEIRLMAGYLSALALALPAYGVCMYLQKVCSSLKRMGLYAAANVVAGAVQVAFCLVATPVWGLNMVAVSSLLFFLSVDVVTFAMLRRRIGGIGVLRMGVALVRALLLGAAGSVVGVGILALLVPRLGLSMGPSLLLTVAGGIPSVVVTFGLALALKVPEASFITSLLGRVVRR